MARPAKETAPRTVGPPHGLPSSLRLLWESEFGAAPPGHFTPSDLPAMLAHLNLCEEAATAYEVMVERNRSRDAAAHWRALQSMLLASRRALRLLPRSRVTPKRAGTLAVGLLNSDEAVYAPKNRDWRALFPKAGK